MHTSYSLFEPKSHVRLAKMALWESVNLLIPLLRNQATLNKAFPASFITLLSNWPIEDRCLNLVL